MSATITVWNFEDNLTISKFWQNTKINRLEKSSPFCRSKECSLSFLKFAEESTVNPGRRWHLKFHEFWNWKKLPFFFLNLGHIYPHAKLWNYQMRTRELVSSQRNTDDTRRTADRRQMMDNQDTNLSIHFALVVQPRRLSPRKRSHSFKTDTLCCPKVSGVSGMQGMSSSVSLEADWELSPVIQTDKNYTSFSHNII